MDYFIDRGTMRIGFESSGSFGQGQLSGSLLIERPWSVNMTDTVAAIETGNLRKGLREESKDVIAGYEGGEVTVEGSLGLDDVILLQAAFLSSELDGTAGTEYMIQDVQGWDNNLNTGSYSLAIYKHVPDKGSDQWDVATGCVMSSLNITGTSGDIVKFTATFRSKKPDKGETVTFVGTPPTLVNECLNFGDTTFSDGTNAEMNSFNLTITNEFTDDANIYTNSVERTRDISIKTMVECEVTRIKSDYDYLLDDLILDDTIQTIQIGLVDGLNSWTNILYGKYMTAEDSTDSNNVIVQTMNLRGMWDRATSNYPIEVTVV